MLLKQKKPVQARVRVLSLLEWPCCPFLSIGLLQSVWICSSRPQHRRHCWLESASNNIQARTRAVRVLPHFRLGSEYILYSPGLNHILTNVNWVPRNLKELFYHPLTPPKIYLVMPRRWASSFFKYQLVKLYLTSNRNWINDYYNPDEVFYNHSKWHYTYCQYRFNRQYWTVQELFIFP